MTHRRWMLLILAVSVLARLASALYMGNQVTELPGIHDQISYHNLALRVLNGYGFSFDRAWWPMTAAGAPTAHWSFLYTLYLVAVYTVFGVQPLTARVIQAVVVGLLHPLLANWLGTRLISPLVGRIAALLTAGYAYSIYYNGALMTEPFYITAILAALALAISISSTQQRRPRWGGLALLGLACGCAVLLRQLFLLFMPFLLGWMLWRMRGMGLARAALRLALPAGVLVAMILPWTVYNAARFDRFVLLNTNAGYAFFWGNHPVYGTHFYGILPPELGSYEELIPEQLRGLDEAALEQALLRRGMQFVIDDPARIALLSISRIPVYFQFWPSPRSGMLSNISRVASFGILWPFMLYGLVRLVRDGYARRLEQPAWLLLLFCIIYTAIHLLTWAQVRYRLPVDAVLLVFAAYGFAQLWQRLPAAYRQFFTRRWMEHESSSGKENAGI